MQNVSDGKGIAVAEELEKGIRNRISDKSRKIRNQNKIGSYKNWWLILIDHVCHVPIPVLSEHELQFIQDRNLDFWSRVVVIGSRSPSWHYDLLAP